MTAVQFQRALDNLEELILSNANREAEIRLMAREKYGRIFVKTYTVKAHFRPLRKRR